MFRAIFYLCCFLLAPASAAAEYATFAEFAADLPNGWSGGEQAGFKTRDKKEYMLSLGRLEDGSEKHLAYVNIYLLPNHDNASAHDFALKMAERQAEATAPLLDGQFWKFEGDPGDSAVKGRAVTRVAANEKWLLIIIAKDPHRLGSEEIVHSLQPLTERAKALLTPAGHDD